MRCEDCGDDIYKMLKGDKWASLFNFIMFLESEQTITPRTYEQMIDCLMAFKSYAYDMDKPDAVDLIARELQEVKGNHQTEHDNFDPYWRGVRIGLETAANIVEEK